MALPAAAVLVKVGGGLAAVSLLGLVLTQGRKKKGPMKVLSGVASLYDVTSYVSDLMSYSRLMALGLTTGVMGMVFNLLGSMFGGGSPGSSPSRSSSWWGIPSTWVSTRWARMSIPCGSSMWSCSPNFMKAAAGRSSPLPTAVNMSVCTKRPDGLNQERNG